MTRQMFFNSVVPIGERRSLFLLLFGAPERERQTLCRCFVCHGASGKLGVPF